MWRASCWKKATLPPSYLESLWRSPHCWGCRPANLGRDWKKAKFSKTVITVMMGQTWSGALQRIDHWQIALWKCHIWFHLLQYSSVMTRVRLLKHYNICIFVFLLSKVYAWPKSQAKKVSFNDCQVKTTSHNFKKDYSPVKRQKYDNYIVSPASIVISIIPIRQALDITQLGLNQICLKEK